MPHRLTLLVTSPRLPAGLLTRDAWTALEGAGAVLAIDAEDPTPAAVTASGVAVDVVSEHASVLARRLADATVEQDVVWIGSPDGDPGLTDALAEELTRLPEPPEVEVLVGSWDPVGARLLDAVAVMDALRSPGGCPWDAEQTHASLTPYLVEEAYEAVEAVETGDPAQLADELGDVLLQVLFHARVAQESPDGFDVDEVAAGLVAKLVRRHPHVFGDGDASTPEEVEAQWTRIKQDEGSRRRHALDGIPASMPALPRAEKALSRLSRAGRDDLVDRATSGSGLGARLLALVAEARAAGTSPDAELRAVLRELEAALDAETADQQAGGSHPDEAAANQ